MQILDANRQRLLEGESRRWGETIGEDTPGTIPLRELAPGRLAMMSHG